MTSEVEALRAQVAGLKEENHTLVGSAAAWEGIAKLKNPELTTLRAEVERLKYEALCDIGKFDHMKAARDTFMQALEEAGAVGVALEGALRLVEDGRCEPGWETCLCGMCSLASIATEGLLVRAERSAV